MKKETKRILTKGLSRPDFVVLAVYSLGGASKGVDTEDVAVKCNELVPGIFIWNKYPDQINLKLIEAFLYDAKKPRYGSLLSGTSRQGWRLTTKGLEWIESRGRKLLEEFSIVLNTSQSIPGSIDAARKERERKRVITSAAWKAKKNGNPLSLSDALKLFRINDYTTEKILEIKVVRFRSMFEDDAEIGPLICEAAELVFDRRNHK